MRLTLRRPSADPVATAVSSVLEGAGQDPGRSDREALAALEGMLTAAVIGPERTRPDEWARVIFGPGLRNANIVRAQLTISALGLMHNTIARDLERQGAGYKPRFLEIAAGREEIELAVQWVEGLITGMQKFHGEAWGRLIDTAQGMRILTPMVVFVNGADGTTPVLPWSAEEIAQAREESLPRLGRVVLAISEYWKARAERAEPAAVEPFRKVGRNEPCPCGSGKKYKKCCLDQAA